MSVCKNNAAVGDEVPQHLHSWAARLLRPPDHTPNADTTIEHVTAQAIIGEMKFSAKTEAIESRR